MRPVRPALLILAGLLLGFWLTWWHPLPRVDAQGVGFFGTSTTGTRTNCTALTGAVVGQTVCLDQAANAWKYYTGASQTTAQWVSGVASLTGVNNVKDFGATGNGTTDDTAAIQAAINAATQTGTNVYLPAGTYVVSSPLTYSTTVASQGLRLIGAGSRATIFDSRVANDGLLVINGGATSTFQFAGELRDFAITTTTAPATSHGIRLTGAWLYTIQNVRVQGLTGDGIRIDQTAGDPDSVSYLSVLHSEFIGNGGWGFNDNSAAGVVVLNHLLVQSSRFQQNTSGGLVASSLIARIALNSFAQNSGPGVYLRKNTNSASAAAITDNEFDANVGQHVRLDSGFGYTVARNLLTFQNLTPPGAFGPAVGVLIGDGGGTSLEATLIAQNRVRSSPNPPTTSVTAFWASSNATNVRIEDTGWQAFSGGTAVRTLDAGTRTLIRDDGVWIAAPSLFGAPNAGHGISLNDTSGGGIPAFKLRTTASAVNNRDWLIAGNYDAAGDFTIRGGSAQGADPYSSGTTYLRIGRTGGVQVGAPGTDTGVGSLAVASAVYLNASQTLWNGGTTTGTPRCTNNCGAAPALIGTNSAMRVTMGATGTPRSPFLVLFNGTWNATPSCIAQLTTATTTTVSVTNATTTGVTVNTVIGPAQGDVYAIHCLGVG